MIWNVSHLDRRWASLESEVGAEVVGDDLGDRSGVAGTVDREHTDAQLAGDADGVLGDEAVPGQSVGLSSGRVADPVPERGGAGQFTALQVTELGRGHHDDHPSG